MSNCCFNLDTAQLMLNV